MKNFIKLERVVINNDQVTFTSGSTFYANEFRVKSINVKHLLKRFSTLTKRLKENGTSVSHKYKTRKYVADNVNAYEVAIVEYNQHFEAMVGIAKFITSKPLPTGTNDNAELNQMYIHRNKCMSMLNRSSIISKVLDFELKIDELTHALDNNDCNYSQICF